MISDIISTKGEASGLNLWEPSESSLEENDRMIVDVLGFSFLQCRMVRIRRLLLQICSIVSYTTLQKPHSLMNRAAPVETPLDQFNLKW